MSEVLGSVVHVFAWFVVVTSLAAQSDLHGAGDKQGSSSQSYTDQRTGVQRSGPEQVVIAHLAGQLAAIVPKTKVNPTDQLRYVWIPPGVFQMGCSDEDRLCLEDEVPQHSVTIANGFWIGQTEVTQGAWQRVIGRKNNKLPGVTLPVNEVNWTEADAYCRKVGGRLPKEAEWEYAARGGVTTGKAHPLRRIAWYERNSSLRPHTVGSRRHNAFGLHDMLGNVGEWVGDRYGPYSADTQTDPAGASVGRFRVARGGSFIDKARDMRASQRAGWDPGLKVIFVGLRCVLN